MDKYSKTALNILLVTQELVQKVGFNGFSYADISLKLDIKKASIHYHFPTKKDLIMALIQMYREEFINQLNLIDKEEIHYIRRLDRFIQLYRKTLEKESKVCLCSILSAEIETLPQGVRKEINMFFEDIEKWLTNLFQRGTEHEELSLQNTPDIEARLLLSVIKGAQLLARTYESIDQFDLIVGNMISYYKK